VVVRLQSQGNADKDIGYFDIYDYSIGKQLFVEPLYETHHQMETKNIFFEVKEATLIPHVFEFRTYWNGSSDMSLHDIEVVHL
jgi:hypothetical protein